MRPDEVSVGKRTMTLAEWRRLQGPPKQPQKTKQTKEQKTS